MEQYKTVYRVNKLFQSFSQVDSSTSRKYGGTDLGDIENMRVLIVGDNSANRHVLRRYLESWQ
ncbi:MAG: hypothetical protein HON76_15475 [Candidatus Scalindua sp.]|nr:hypothetical protein [Candidatus Scalindua sp.]MBT6047603.1 hypothetical protein [Candidatus Scalindua sp.]MBT6563920.1 hypothetical protein [Candidatus Scalindua sp.]MBT7592252.1 hypothetical protein [Candidatus Scalindua sp.]